MVLRKELSIPICSTKSALFLSLIPAVSIKLIKYPFRFIASLIVSLVVPSIGVTIALV
jgi:hypothetical protein